MANRRYIGYSQNGPTALRGLSHAGGAPDRPLMLLEENEVENLVQDFTDYLDTGETVSSATATTEGSVSAGTPSVSSPKVTTQISGAKSWGRVTLQVTMSSGVIVETKIEVRERRRYRESRSLTDYIGSPW